LDFLIFFFVELLPVPQEFWVLISPTSLSVKKGYPFPDGRSRHLTSSDVGFPSAPRVFGSLSVSCFVCCPLDVFVFFFWRICTQELCASENRFVLFPFPAGDACPLALNGGIELFSRALFSAAGRADGMYRQPHPGICFRPVFSCFVPLALFSLSKFSAPLLLIPPTRLEIATPTQA